MRTFRLAATYLRLGALNELQYRANFFVSVFQSGLAVAVGLAVLALVYSHTPSLNGWTHSELMVVLGVQILLGGVIHALIQPNMQQLMDEVRDGKLDHALTKPEDAQLIVSLRTLRLWQLTEVVSGAAVIGVGVSRLDAGIGLGRAVAVLARRCGERSLERVRRQAVRGGDAVTPRLRGVGARPTPRSTA
jgi:ABC-2 type transport system permease protein